MTKTTALNVNSPLIEVCKAISELGFIRIADKSRNPLFTVRRRGAVLRQFAPGWCGGTRVVERSSVDPRVRWARARVLDIWRKLYIMKGLVPSWRSMHRGYSVPGPGRPLQSSTGRRGPIRPRALPATIPLGLFQAPPQ